MTRLHRVQNSVWAGDMTKLGWEDLRRDLQEIRSGAQVQAWIFLASPEIHRFGSQGDQLSTFV